MCIQAPQKVTPNLPNHSIFDTDLLAEKQSVKRDGMEE